MPATGHYYPPYVYGGYYYPYAATYGYRTYNPYTGAYGYGASAYGPYGSAHWGTSYNPNTGTYARGATASTPIRHSQRWPGLQPVHGRRWRHSPGLKCLRIMGTVSGHQEWQHGIHATREQCLRLSRNGADVAGGRGAATSTAYGNTAVGKSPVATCMPAMTATCTRTPVPVAKRRQW